MRHKRITSWESPISKAAWQLKQVLTEVCIQMRHTANIESPIHVGFESGLRVVEAHSQTAVSPYL